MRINKVPSQLIDKPCWCLNYPNSKIPIWLKNLKPEKQSYTFESLALQNSRLSDNTAVSIVLSQIPALLVIDLDIQDIELSNHADADIKLNTKAKTFITQARDTTYIEKSFSGHGYHIMYIIKEAFFWYKAPRNAITEFSGELLIGKGFSCFTGNSIGKSHIKSITSNELITLLPSLRKTYEYLVKETTKVDTIIPISTSTSSSTSTSILTSSGRQASQEALALLSFKLDCLSPWPTDQIKKAYSSLILHSDSNINVNSDTASITTTESHETKYDNYDFWVRIIMAVKDYVINFNISNLDALALLDSWSRHDITKSYDKPNTSGLTGFDSLNAVYKSIDLNTSKTSTVTYKTLDAFLSQGLMNGEQVLNFMNQRHFCLKTLQSYRYGCIQTFSLEARLQPNVHNLNTLSILPKHSLLEMYSNKHFYMPIKSSKTGRTTLKRLSYAQYWVDHEKRREVSSMVFRPDNKVANDEHNLWEGFTVGTYNAANSPEFFLVFIKDVICNGDVKLNHYVLSWIANIIQHPTKKSNVALVLISEEQGTGKSFLVELLGSMLGKSYKTVGYNSSLTARFNAMYQNKLLVGVEEAIYMHNKKDQSLLKHLISSPTIDIERKGFDIQDNEPNYMRFILTANTLKAVAIEGTDRRFQVIQVNTSKINNRKYFGELYKTWYYEGGREAFFYYLKNYDIKKFDFVKQRINTKIADEQKLHSLDRHTQWYHEWITTGFTDISRYYNAQIKVNLESSKYQKAEIFGKHKINPIDDASTVDTYMLIKHYAFRVPRDVIYEDYLEFCNRHHVRYPMVKLHFKNMVFTLSKASLAKSTLHKAHVAFWCFESLIDLRKIFLKHFNIIDDPYSDNDNDDSIIDKDEDYKGTQEWHKDNSKDNNKK